jgi:hypothetical protein
LKSGEWFGLVAIARLTRAEGKGTVWGFVFVSLLAGRLGAVWRDPRILVLLSL